MLKQTLTTFVALFSMITVLLDVMSGSFFYIGYGLIAIALPACYYGIKENATRLSLSVPKVKNYI